MALFSTPKSIKARSKAKAAAKAKANERGKPRDVGEKYEVKRRLKKKYPQMFGGPKLVKVGARKVRLSDDDAAEIDKMRDKNKR